MSHVPSVEISELAEHKSFSGNSSVSSEMFSPSPSNEHVSIIKTGSNCWNNKTKLGNLFSGEDQPFEDIHIQLPSLQTLCENSPLLTGYGFDSTKTVPKRSIRKSHRISKSESTTSISSHRSKSQPVINEQFSSSISPEKLHSMDESQLRDTLQKSLLENSNLLEEVQIKDKAIRRLSECLNDIQVFSKTRRHSTNNDFQSFSIGQADSASGDTFNSNLFSSGGMEERKLDLEKLALTNQNQLCVYSLETVDVDKAQIVEMQDSKTSLFEEFSIAIRENRPALEQNVITGTYIAKDVLLGGSVGWLSAYLLKKFGTTALTAMTGGMIVIHLAARKGYVIVNWGEIYKKIEKQSEENEEIKNEMEWIGDKVNDVKSWIQQHKYVAGGLAVSFIYNIFK